MLHYASADACMQLSSRHFAFAPAGRICSHGQKLLVVGHAAAEPHQQTAVHVTAMQLDEACSMRTATSASSSDITLCSEAAAQPGMLTQGTSSCLFTGELDPYNKAVHLNEDDGLCQPIALPKILLDTWYSMQQGRFSKSSSAASAGCPVSVLLLALATAAL